MSTTIIAPSLLSADFSDLRSVLKSCKDGGAEYIHVDIMDNHFVPNLTIGPVVIKSLRNHTNLFLDVHLMVTDPLSLVTPFVAAGADGITFHLEAVEYPREIIDEIHDHGKQAGMSIKPKTPVTALEPFVNDLDLVLMMSVEPGFGGQDYLIESTERIMELKRLLTEYGLQDSVLIEVDGGIKVDNARMVVDAGADILVSGSGIFGTPDPVEAIRKFKRVVS